MKDSKAVKWRGLSSKTTGPRGLTPQKPQGSQTLLKTHRQPLREASQPCTDGTSWYMHYVELRWSSTLRATNGTETPCPGEICCAARHFFDPPWWSYDRILFCRTTERPCSKSSTQSQLLLARLFEDSIAHPLSNQRQIFAMTRIIPTARDGLPSNPCG